MRATGPVRPPSVGGATPLGCAALTLGLRRGEQRQELAEDAIPTKTIAEAIGERIGLPVTAIAPDDAVAHFGFIGQFFGRDMSSSSTLTRATYGWEPTGPTHSEDIAAGAYDPE